MILLIYWIGLTIDVEEDDRTSSFADIETQFEQEGLTIDENGFVFIIHIFLPLPLYLYKRLLSLEKTKNKRDVPFLLPSFCMSKLKALIYPCISFNGRSILYKNYDMLCIITISGMVIGECYY